MVTVKCVLQDAGSSSAALLRTDIILAAITVLCLVGLVCYGAVHAGEVAVRRWHGE